jgi:hypothetical protein
LIEEGARSFGVALRFEWRDASKRPRRSSGIWANPRMNGRGFWWRYPNTPQRTTPPPASLDAKLLFDADKLDGLGAVGISKTAY